MKRIYWKVAGEKITDHEKRICEMVLKDKSYEDIAKEWNRSLHTIRTEVKTLFDRLRIHNKGALINMLHKHGIEPC